MNPSRRTFAGCYALLLLTPIVLAQTTAPHKADLTALAESPAQRDARMAWWREARFGMFIHWGLYSTLAGEWKGETKHAEWIRHTAQIPLEEYDQIVRRFNPVKFDAAAWAKVAREAGMRYIVITSKHHDGFCLFDSRHTDFDVAASPFGRDILKELAEATRAEGLKMCWYHSIMDWHHPDYLPRREWESRASQGADLDRYVGYMKAQLAELINNYGPIGVLWFDGEWEDSWTHPRGVDLYNYVRGLQADIIVNNRVDVGRSGMAGMTRGAEFAGDFGTPEQEIPATGLPGIDWETCMTMNDNWGFNRADQKWKSVAELLHNLADIASKGGNFLLNVGPTGEGEFPPQSLERLAAIGAWMRVNGDSIYGTRASPFKSLPWGRCTQKPLASGDTRLFLHVFDWPADGKLRIPGLLNESRSAALLADAGATLSVARDDDALVISLPEKAPDPVNSVVMLDIAGAPDTSAPPTIAAPTRIFTDKLDVTISSPRENVEIRYSLSNIPSATATLVQGAVTISDSSVLRARIFRDGKPVSEVAEARFTKVTPQAAVAAHSATPGLSYEYYEGDWRQLPDFEQLTSKKSGAVQELTFAPRDRSEKFAFRFSGYFRAPRDGVYSFHLASDDGSRLWLSEQLLIDNDGLHSLQELTGVVALASGAHPIVIEYFEQTGGDALTLEVTGPELPRTAVTGEWLVRD